MDTRPITSTSTVATATSLTQLDGPAAGRPGKKGGTNADRVERGGSASVPTPASNGAAVLNPPKAGPGCLAGTPHEAVQKLLGAYGEERAPGRPRERLLKWVAFVDEQLRKHPDVDDLIHYITKTTDQCIDLRRHVFLLEGGFRFYRNRYGQDMEAAMERCKALEDALGRFTDARKLKTLAKDKGFPPPVVAYLEKSELSFHDALKSLLKKGWMPDADGKIPEIGRAIETLMSRKWDGYSDDHTYVRENFAAYIKSVHKKDYDMDDLQNGLHEFRRNLRWIPVFAEGLDGLVVLDPKNTPPGMKKYLDMKLATDKYCILPQPEREVDPIYISKASYVALMKGVLDFGDLKDVGEQIHFLSEALIESGLLSSHKQAIKMTCDLLGFEPDALDKMHAEAHVKYDAMHDSKLLKLLRADFDA